MATGSQNLKGIPDKLRKQLALAVRSIQWSYAIFWSSSATQQGTLEWQGGYYNGDIKTRKTVQAVDLDADQLGLQRCDQLRELYESLLLGDNNPQAKRPTAALSPEDLTDAEWYFLVCMSFKFKIGEGLPGWTIAKHQPFWLCNAHLADTKDFSRSILAKSASIQTIVCFPHLDGVVELGTTELVPEDLGLIQHIKTTFLECSDTIPDIASYTFSNGPSNRHIPEVPDHVPLPEDGVEHLLDCPDTDACSPNNSSEEFADNVLIEDSNLLEAMNEEVTWPFMDDAISNVLNMSTNSSDSVSQTYGNPETAVPPPDSKNANNNYVQECDQQKQNIGPQGDSNHYQKKANNNFVQECDQQKQNIGPQGDGIHCQKKGNNNYVQECDQQTQNLGPQGDDIHYQSVLSNLLKSSQQLILGPHVRNGQRESSFVSWKKDGLSVANVPKCGTPQKLLKKVLFEVARMHETNRLESGKRNAKNEGQSKPAVEEMDRNHVLSERKRREKMNERFMILGSLIPSGGKVDKVSILDHTIEYLRKLERKVAELQSNSKVTEQEPMILTKPQDDTEGASDNCCNNQTSNIKKPQTNKRKACSSLDKSGAENSRSRSKAPPVDSVTVNITDKDVLIELRCPWKECVLMEIIEALKKLHWHSESVQSSNADGMLSMTIKAKYKGLKAASANVIRQSLLKVIRKS